LKRFILILSFFICTGTLWASGSHEKNSEKESRPIVFAANYPLYYICQRYAGDSIELIWPYSEDEDPAFWEPGDQNIRELQAADLLVLNGAGYEKWLEYSFIDPNLILDSSSRFKENYISSASGASHSHGGGDLHDHGATAFTLWLDLKFYSLQAESVFESLLSLLPEEKDILEQNHRELLKDLETLDQSFQLLGEEFKSETLLASHPIYQYFSRAYTGDIKPLLLEPDIFPSEEDWDNLANLKKEYNTSLMIWEGEPLPETQLKLDDLGIHWIEVSPGFNMPQDGDFLDILKNNLEELKRLRDMKT
jgi:zinc transport system substrate-binding protein